LTVSPKKWEPVSKIVSSHDVSQSLTFTSYSAHHGLRVAFSPLTLNFFILVRKEKVKYLWCFHYLFYCVYNSLSLDHATTHTHSLSLRVYVRVTWLRKLLRTRGASVHTETKTYADVFWHMLTYTDVCRRMLSVNTETGPPTVPKHPKRKELSSVSPRCYHQWPLNPHSSDPHVTTYVSIRQ
jgi:hypothetical protein